MEYQRITKKMYLWKEVHEVQMPGTIVHSFVEMMTGSFAGEKKLEK